MQCTNCGHINDDGSQFCGNCGSSFSAISTPVTATYNDPNTHVEQVKSFFQNTFLGIIKSILSQPINGTYAIFANAKSEAYNHALILIITTGLVYIFLPFLFMSRQFGGEFGMFFKLGIFLVLILVIISTLTFIVKSISGKTDFKRELLTGGICGIPMMLSISVIGVLMLFSSPYSFDLEDMLSQGILVIALQMYCILMLFNIIQQSLKASGTNDALSWYISPVIIVASFYIGVKIAQGLLLPSY